MKIKVYKLNNGMMINESDYKMWRENGCLTEDIEPTEVDMLEGLRRPASMADGEDEGQIRLPGIS